MKQIFLLLCLYFSLVSCSTDSSQKRVSAPSTEPVWVYAPSEGCSETVICASGEGNSFTQSDLNSMKSLASIFETHIYSKFQFSKQSFSGLELTQMKESVSSEVTEYVSEILKGVEIKERFHKDKFYFSLAVLDKVKTGKVLRNEITRIDNQMQHYFKMKNRLYLKKLNYLHNQRMLLNEKLVIILGVGVDSPISFKEINDLKYKSLGGEKIMLKQLNKIPLYIVKKIEEQLIGLGYFVSKDKYDYLVNLKFTKKDEYLNVVGFNKFTFTLDVTSKTSLGKKLGSFNLVEVESGRSHSDVFLKVKTKIIKKFENNIDKLNLK